MCEKIIIDSVNISDCEYFHKEYIEDDLIVKDFCANWHCYCRRKGDCYKKQSKKVSELLKDIKLDVTIEANFPTYKIDKLRDFLYAKENIDLLLQNLYFYELKENYIAHYGAFEKETNIIMKLESRLEKE